MIQALLGIASIPLTLLLLITLNTGDLRQETNQNIPHAEEISVRDKDMLSGDEFKIITGIVHPKDTLESIFTRHELDKGELSEIYRSARKQYDLSRISVGNMYAFEIEKETGGIRKMQYGIDDMSFLSVLKESQGFSAEKVTIRIDRRIGSFVVNIQDNLMLSMPGTHKEYYRLAQLLADIYAWDIDVTRDIRNGDTVKFIVEELWAGEVFRGFGNILAAEFINDGTSYYAYRFEHDGYADYYDENGKSLRKTLLRSPLKFKYISSYFSKRRFHPKLKRYRPHLAVDYAAPAGTPVSAAGSGKVMFAGYKGQTGRMVKIKHPGGYETYYGHLSRIPKKISRGTKVSQGDVIGYVGSTGLATGPHLDYRIRYNGKFVDPLKIRLPRGKPVPDHLMAEFKNAVHEFVSELASLNRPIIASEGSAESPAG